MAQMLTRRELLRKGGLAAAVVSATSVIGSSALAQEPVAHVPLGEDTPIVDAAEDLKPFTSKGGVGIIFHYKEWEGGYTPDQLTRGFVSKFQENNTNADVRVVESEEPGAVVFFVIKDVSQGPYAAKDAYAMITDIAAQNRFAHGIRTSGIDANIEIASNDPKVN